MFKANVFLLFVLFFAQANVVQAKHSSCDHALSLLVEKVEENYAGYPDKNRDRIELVKKQIDERINNNPDNECLLYLSQWLESFSDPQLKVTHLVAKTQDSYTEIEESDQSVTLELLSKDIALITLPSFRQELTSDIADLRDKYYSMLMSVQGLIIDLRGNDEGSLMAMHPVIELIGAYDYHSRWHVLSSPPNTLFYRQQLAEDRLNRNPELFKIFSELVVNMNTFPNTWLEYSWPPVSHDKMLTNLEMVYIIQNGEVAFSGEEFIIAAKTNDKVTTFGSTTKGELDYAQPITHQILGKYGVHIPSQKRVWYQLGPIDNVGIAPDVALDISDDSFVDYLHQKMVEQFNSAK
ncbi:S41 family peptidase [Vibrio kasasachensis]|uniref:S41 family peptidase n=1 Tax=Vibrio kasasachensis TaxID=2910248 RepID=UPI003D103B0A